MSVGFFSILMFILVAILYFLPTYIAVKKNHPNKIPIILINVFLGLFWGLGWFVALIWAIVGDGERQTIMQPIEVKATSIADEIERLHKLKVNGVISEADFEAQKSAVLKSSNTK